MNLYNNTKYVDIATGEILSKSQLNKIYYEWKVIKVIESKPERQGSYYIKFKYLITDGKKKREQQQCFDF